MEAGCRAGGPSHRRRRTDDPDVDEPRSGIHEGLCDRPYRLRGYGVAVGVEQVGTGGADRGRNLVGDPGRSVRDKYAHQDVDPLDELRQRGGVLEAGVDGQRPSALTAASETRQRANAVGLQDHSDRAPHGPRAQHSDDRRLLRHRHLLHQPADATSASRVVRRRPAPQW
jgi:hypothetical protein